MISEKRSLIARLMIGLIFIISSCKDDEEFHTVGIDLNANYNQDEVKVMLDGKVLLNEPLQTDLSTSVATTLRVKKTNGKHTLKIIINDTLEKTEVISVKNDLYVFVGYNPVTQEILFNYSDHPVFYD